MHEWKAAQKSRSIPSVTKPPPSVTIVGLALLGSSLYPQCEKKKKKALRYSKMPQNKVIGER